MKTHLALCITLVSVLMAGCAAPDGADGAGGVPTATIEPTPASTEAIPTSEPTEAETVSELMAGEFIADEISEISGVWGLGFRGDIEQGANYLGIHMDGTGVSDIQLMGASINHVGEYVEIQLNPPRNDRGHQWELKVWFEGDQMHIQYVGGGKYEISQEEAIFERVGIYEAHVIKEGDTNVSLMLVVIEETSGKRKRDPLYGHVPLQWIGPFGPIASAEAGATSTP